MAVPKEKFGSIAKPSTRIIITLAAINISPKLFVRDCTVIIANDKIPCVKPEGRPRLTILPAYFLTGFKYENPISKYSVILFNLRKQRTADTAWEIMVAHATPLTPIPNLATNNRSNAIFKNAATTR